MRHKTLHFLIVIAVFLAVVGLCQSVFFFQFGFVEALIQHFGFDLAVFLVSFIGGFIGIQLGMKASTRFLGIEKIPMELRQVNKENGMLLQIRVHRKFQERLGFFVSVLENENSIPLQSTFFAKDLYNGYLAQGFYERDPDNPKASIASIFIPYNAFVVPYGVFESASGALTLRIASYIFDKDGYRDPSESIETIYWKQVEVNPAQVLLEPLIGLVLYVSQQSGGFTKLREQNLYALLYNLLYVDLSTDPTVQDLIHQGPQVSVEDYIEQMKERHPMLDRHVFCMQLAFLCDIDGRLPPETVDFLREMILAWGDTEEEWLAFAEDVGLFYARDLYLEAHGPLPQ